MTESDIKALLKEHGVIGKNEYNAKAWAHFLKQARKDKKWAKDVTRTWLLSASDMSKKMYHDILNTPVEVMAAKSYGYSHYRGHAGGGAYGGWLDRTAHGLWEKFESND